jgi:hypothetical protein
MDLRYFELVWSAPFVLLKHVPGTKLFSWYNEFMWIFSVSLQRAGPAKQ